MRPRLGFCCLETLTSRLHSASPASTRTQYSIIIIIIPSSASTSLSASRSGKSRTTSCPPVHRQADGWWYGRVNWLYTPCLRCLWCVYCGGQSCSDSLLRACTMVVRVARDVERQAAQATATAGTQETAATLTPVCTVQSVRQTPPPLPPAPRTRP